MTLGEIKAEALMLMFSDLDFCGDEDTLINDALISLRADGNYKYYFNALDGAINRAFSSLEQKGILPTKQVDLSCEQGTEIGGRVRFELEKEIPDIFTIEKIHVYTKEGISSLCEYDIESRNTIVVKNIKNAIYTVVYTPEIKRVTPFTSYSENIDLPDDISSVIPYFVKGDLFRYENSDEAAESRNIYESMCDEMLEHKNSATYYTKSVYSLGRI